MATTTEIKSAAELERQRLARLARRAGAAAERQAQEAETEIERQAQEAIAETGQQAGAARTQAEREAAREKAEIRKLTGKAEREAQTAIGKARAAKALELRKQDLPFTRPQKLGLQSYMATVESARQQAHKQGRDATATVTRIKDEYFSEVDKAQARAVTEIQKQKSGIIKDIRLQLANYDADLTKQVARLSSGIKEWEDDAMAAIDKAQAEYQAAIRAELNRPGTEVFADMKGQGLIPANAIYQDYDKTTGQLDYTIPDNRSGEEIFAAEQAAGNIPDDAKYKSYDSSTGQLTYEVPKKTGAYLNTAPNTTAPGPASSNVVTAAGITAMAGAATITLAGTGVGVAAIPTPPTWAIGGILLATAGIIAILNRERIAAGVADLVNRIRGATADAATSQASSQASSAVITNNAGTVAYSPAQIRVIPREKGAGVLTFPLRPVKPITLETPLDVTVPRLPGFGLTDTTFRLPGTARIPRTVDQIIIRDPFDVPELRQKGANIMFAAAAVQAASNNAARIATKELGISRTEYQRLWDQVNAQIRQGRAAQGRQILEDIARAKTGDVAIQRHMRLAYEDYLRKKAILDAARKSYVASLNPQPVKGAGSSRAIAAATGVFVAQDIIIAAIQRELNKGESLKSAMSTAQTTIQSMASDMGLTRQQINAANAAVVYDLAVSSMTQAAITTSTIGQTQGWTATELQTRTFNAAKQAFQTITNTAVNTGTLTKTQANSMTQELTRVAEQVTTLTNRIKLPKPKIGKAATEDKGKYPDGTIVWRMGSLKGKHGHYKIIPPPYRMLKPITSSRPPKGMTRTKGTPQQTLTFLGGKVPFNNVSFDLGVTDGFIDVKSRTINFTGGGQQTNVGQRLPSTTRGVSLTDQPPLLQQLAQRPAKGSGRQMSKGVLSVTGGGRSARSSASSRGVFADSKGQRISRRHHRGWKRKKDILTRG